ncbi:TIM-barrel domain-containing protein [Flavobacterium sp. TBRC 19031]|uniref:TIM-barrel domain-containing protein n=1 Tax=Flavobacterium mekongense TaxID=3379707 RepID=UPI003999F66F
MKKILFLLLFAAVTFAQNANRNYLSHTWKNNLLEVKTSDGTYRIKPYSDKIVETSFIPNGEVFNANSHAVIKTQEKINTTVSKTDSSISLVTNNITVVINKSPFRITYSNQGKVLLSEKNGYIKKDSTEILQFNLDNSEMLFGGGARALGMNRRGNRLTLYNRAHYGYETRAELMNFCIPLVLSSKLYAVHFDNGAIGHLDLDSKKNNTLEYETISGRKTYQVIVGDTWEDLISNYTDLTGKQPMPARWTLGNFSSRFGYHTQEEVEKTINRFQTDGIPVDAIILDLYWFGKTVQGTMGNLDWDKDQFPNPEKMIADLKAKGVKTILITEPFILTTSSKWQEAADQKVLVTDKSGKPATWDFYFGNTGVVDIFKPEGNQWFWSVYKRLINQGVGGMWGDLGEPEVFPSKVVTAAGKADEVHNIYGHHWAKLIADGYKKDFPNQRPFILMRAGYSGSQRFGMMPWSGDVSRSWGGLQSQMEIAMQMGMQGMAYMHSDLGGFAGDYFDNELYLRWLQYGVFNPIFRPHAQEDVASEVAYKDVHTKAKAKKAVELRYQLLPYNYTLAFENNQKGTPLMRPLFFEEPSNEKLLNEKESYFWGDAFLIKPITKAGVTSTEVYFPKSNNWFDFYTDKKYAAGSTEAVAVAETSIPTFVRGGSFVPMIETIQNTTKYSLDNFNLHFYFDDNVKTSTGKLYNDNGESPEAFEKGQYEILNFNSNNNGNILVLKLTATVGKNYVSTDKNVTVVVHNLKAKRIYINGQETIFKTNNESLYLPLTWKKGTSPEIKIEY